MKETVSGKLTPFIGRPKRNPHTQNPNYIGLISKNIPYYNKYDFDLSVKFLHKMFPPITAQHIGYSYWGQMKGK